MVPSFDWLCIIDALSMTRLDFLLVDIACVPAAPCGTASSFLGLPCLVGTPEHPVPVHRARPFLAFRIELLTCKFRFRDKCN